MKKAGLFIMFFFLMICSAQQKPAFWEDVKNFKRLNLETPPPKGAVLLLGSSSFTKWTDVSDYFPGKTIINRGFGGSTLLDLNFYSDELLKPYHPRQILIYCGENDFAQSPQLRPRQVLNRFRNFYNAIRAIYPTVQVDYISMKMSPSRENLWPKMMATNQLIKNYLAKEKNAGYIDITKAMKAPDGRPKAELFLEDRLHMQPEGYRIWAKEISPYLK